MENPVIIIGTNHIGKLVLEIFDQNEVVVFCFLDDNDKLHNTQIGEVSVLGSYEDEEYLALIQNKCEYFIASDDNLFRKTVGFAIEEDQKKKPVNAIHSKAIISTKTEIGYGNFIDSGSIIKPNAVIGDYCNINSGAVIGVDVKIGNYVQVGTNTTVSENVIIGDKTFLGAGVTIVSGIKIGSNVRVGAGAVVISDVGDNQTIFGNPAKAI